MLRFRLGYYKFFLVTLFLVLYWRHFSHFNFLNGSIPQDFKVYTDSVALLKQGISPYNYEIFLTFKYSPGVLAFLTLLPENSIHAWMVAKALYLGLYFLAIYFCFPIKSWRDFSLLLGGFILSWKGVIEALDYGQFEFLLFFFSYVGFLIINKKPLLSGFLVGILPWLKLPWGLLFIPAAILAKKVSFDHLTKVIFGAVLSGLLLIVVAPLFIYTPLELVQIYSDWFAVLTKQPKYLMYLEVANQSVWASISRWVDYHFVVHYVPFLQEPTEWIDRSNYRLEFSIGLFASISLVGISLWRFFRFNREDVALHWLVLLALINPLSWRWSQLLFVGVLFTVKKSILRQSFKWVGVAILGCLYLLQLNPVLRVMGLNHWTQLHVYGLITFQWLIYYIFSLQVFSKALDLNKIKSTTLWRRINFASER